MADDVQSRAELLEFPWDDDRGSVIGFVNAEQYTIFRKTGYPEQFASADEIHDGDGTGNPRRSITAWLTSLSDR